MRLKMVLFTLVVVVSGCGRFGAGSGPVSNSSANTNTTTAKVGEDRGPVAIELARRWLR